MIGTDLTAGQVLRAAADYFAEDPARWGRGYFLDPFSGCRCALGAVAWAIRPDDVYANPELMGGGQDPVRALANYLVDHLDATMCYGDNEFWDNVETVGGWNDDEARTVDEVIAALRGAADEADAADARAAARRDGAA